MVNPAFEFVTGYKREEVIGKTPAVLQSGVHELNFYLEMWQKNTTRWHLAGRNMESSENGRRLSRMVNNYWCNQ